MSGHPLSYGQLALWHMQRLLPNDVAYNVPLGLRILSHLDVADIRRVCQLLVDRHAALRTTYALEDRDPVQIVHPHLPVPLRVVEGADWTGEAVADYLAGETGRPFDLARGPMMRATLVTRDAGRHLLLLVFHHIAVDLWSLTLLVEEMGRLARAVRDQTPPPPPPGATPLDFVRWQRALIAGRRGATLWEYWRRQFDGGVEPVALPVDVEARASDATPGTSVPFRLPRELSEDLRRLAQDTRTTLNVVLLAAFETLLRHHSGQPAFLLRTLAAGRSRAEFEPVIGFFANPVVLRADFSGDPGFAELVGRVRANVSGAIEHQDLPFELLVERLGLGRVTRYNPNPRAMFILQTPHRLLEEQRSQSRLAERGVFAAGDTGVRLDLGGLIVEKHNPPQRTTLNDLALEMVELGGELSGAFHYRSDLFRVETVVRLAGHYEQILAQAVADPRQPVSAYRLEPSIQVGRAARRSPDRRSTAPGPETGEPVAAVPEAAGAPATPEEAELARIFTEVLGGRAIGPRDNFFDAGGHSLLALQLIGRVRDTFEVELPLRQLFDVPTIAGLARVLGASRRSAEPVRITAASRRDPLPLSFAQERLWFQDRLEGAPLVIPLALRVAGPLDADALARSFTEVVSRHEVLRTTLPASDGEPSQVVHRAWRVEIPVADLGTVPAPERPDRVERLAREHAAVPFDLERGPLVRARLLRVSPDEHILLLNLHHVVADGWSLGVLLREIAHFYAADLAGARAPLPPLPIQYADYACWQRETWEGGGLGGQLAYWRSRLEGLTPLALPVDRPRPAVQSFDGASRSFRVDPAVTAALRSLGEREGTTLFMTLLAVFQVLLARHTGQGDIAVGTPIAGRGRRELDALVGCFVNLLVLRSDVADNPTFHEVLRRVREVCLGAYAHQELPFEKLVEHLQPARDLARQPLFQVMFVLENAPMPPLRLTGDVTLAPLEIARTVTGYDLTLFVTEADGGLDGRIEYRRDLFDPATIDRLIRRLLRLTASAALEPASRLSDLPMLDPDEERRLLREWSGAGTPPVESACVHRLIEARAAETPRRVAVESRGQKVTYAALNARANRLARCLVSRGARPGALVAIELARSPGLLAALLATWKAGAAFTCLDPRHPRARRDAVLADARPAVLVSDCRRGDPGAIPEGTTSVDAADLWREAATRAASNAGQAVTPDDLAYVAFTSGSTGRPKGVMVSHAALSNYLAWCASSYEMDAGAGVPFYTSPSFDFAATSLFAPLTIGQRVVVVPDAGGSPGAGLLAETAEWSVLKITPSFAAALADQGEVVDVPSARHLVFGGERLAGGHVRPWRQAAPAVIVVNEYGPTEATVGCCQWRARAGEIGDGDVPIGRPLPGARVYVLGRWLDPVPVGVAGELFVAGQGLARGYLNRPDLTAERFVADPFSPRPGDRMYRTGDRARWRPDGVLEYLGRVDDQIQIRGCRVEPGEVESALEALPGVRRAAVIALSGAARLEAFVVCQGADADPAALHASLRRMLPEEMVPARIRPVDDLPIDASGKTDRGALAALASAASDVREPAGRAPTSETERAVAAAWREVLGRDRIAVDEDFFDLGGHSLAAVRVAARLSARFGGALALVDLFQARTIAQLASLVDGRAAERASRPDSPLVRLGGSEVDTAPTLVCIHPSGGVVECYRELARLLCPAVSLVALQSRAVGCAQAEHGSLDAMAEAYARIIGERVPTDPLRLLGWSMGANVAAHVAARLEREGRAVASVTMLDPGAGRRTGAGGRAMAAAAAEALGHATRSTVPASSRRAVVAEIARAYSGAAGRDPAGRAAAVAAAVRSAVPGAADELVEFAREQVLLVERHEALVAGARLPALACSVDVFLSADPGAAARRAVAQAASPRARVHRLAATHVSMLTGDGVERVARHLTRTIVRPDPAAGRRAPSAARAARGSTRAARPPRRRSPAARGPRS